MKTSITAITSHNRQSPIVLELIAAISVPAGASANRLITLTINNKSVQIAAKVKLREDLTYRCVCELWSLTNVLRNAGILHATDTLVSGGEYLTIVSGQINFVAKGEDYEDEILHAEETIE